MDLNPGQTRSLLQKYRTIIFLLLLTAITFGVYARVTTYDFVNFDDFHYVSANAVVQKGVSLQGLKYAFSITEEKRAYWHPLTWLSHMMDCHFFGLNAGMHHLHNVLLHILNSLLLFLVFHSMTGAFLQSAIMATLFALHPLSVDSVAWIAERKNVLSTSFWMLTMWTYIFYSKNPGTSRYLLVLAVFTLGLLTKPILTTLPFVLLIMDFWPMNRMRLLVLKSGAQAYPQISVPKLILEKVPLLIAGLTAIFISSYSLKILGVYLTAEYRPIPIRIENAIVSYVKYIGKTIWPDNLAVFYLFPESIPLWKVLGASLLLVAVSTLVIKQLKTRPWFAVGWFWFLGTLFPVSGLVQGGLWPEMADRWAYVPQIGIFMMITWPVAGLVDTTVIQRRILAIVTGLLLVILCVTTWAQVGYWKNSKTLFYHALAVTGENEIVHRNIGQALSQEKDYDRAIEHYRRANELNPRRPEVHIGLGKALVKKKALKEAMQHFTIAIKLKPQDPTPYVQMGLLLNDEDRPHEAVEYFQKALAIKPEDVVTRYNFGLSLAESNNFEAGEKEVLKILSSTSDKGEGFYNVGVFYGKFKKQGQAIPYLEKALVYHPEHPQANYNLGIIAADQNRYHIAEKHFLITLASEPDNVNALNNLGLLYSKTGRLNMAIQQFKKALEFTPHDNLVRFNLADTLLQVGNLGAASKQFAMIIENDPDHAGARLGRQQASQYLAAMDSEIARTESLLRFDPESPALLVKMGDLYLKKGDAGRGIEYYRNVHILYPDHPGVLNKIAAAFNGIGNYAEAISYFRKVIDIAPEKPEGYFNVACMYSKLNEIKNTDRWLKMALERGYEKWQKIKTDEDLRNYRKTDEYKKLLKAK